MMRFGSRQRSRRPTDVRPRAAPRPPYLTDGTELYRLLTVVPAQFGELLALENCRSLQIGLLHIDDLSARPMRGVSPSVTPRDENHEPDHAASISTASAAHA